MTVVLGLAPVFAIILLGYILRRRASVPDSFWPAAEQMTFYLFFPALLLTNTAQANFAAQSLGGMVGAVVSAVLIVLALAIAAARALRLDGPATSSLIQGAIRPNVYLATATAAALAGDAGLIAVSLCIAVVVPLVNVIAVVALVRCATPGAAARSGLIPLAVSIARNPLIVACLAGLALNALAIPLPPVVGPLLQILARAALPLGLLAVGAGLDLQASRRAGPAVVAAAGLKLVALPLITLALCSAFELTGVPRLIGIMFASLPISASAYVMARQMGGNAPMLASAITATTIGAAVTMPLLLAAIS
ncbi:MAG: AEC family transporter [Defluviicoccus sp.]